MNKNLFKDILGWGFLLWLIGYLLGIILFFLVPPAILGWVIMPIGIFITVWVLLKKISLQSIQQYLFLALGWTLIAVFCDYFFLVKVFQPADGYYKLDVYFYYAFSFILPLVVGWKKLNSGK